MKNSRLRLKLYRYMAGELAPEEQARRSRPRLATGRVLYWKLGRWVYCARMVRS